jgi:hypothetical protein
MLHDYRFEPMSPTATRRWVLVCDRSGEILRSHELRPFDDPRTALSSVAEELRRDGWNSVQPEQHPFFAASRGCESIQVSLSIVSPELLRRESFLST